MKLLRMEFSGIGSFADRMEIDFQQLSEAGLFLIEGPTGSGKSTILDALVYALYGSVAAQSGDLGRLDSQMRDDPPSVTLDFEVQGIRYQVNRVPKHERKKQRGEGMTAGDSTASLMRADGDEWTYLGRMHKEVGAEIAQIIGLSKEQFASTVVLAQGEFANFLDAGTKERGAILERVFGTQKYTNIETKLAEMRTQAEAEVADAERAVALAANACLGALGIEIEEGTDAMAAIDAALAQLQSDHEVAEESLRAAEKQRKDAQQALDDARTLAKRQNRKREALARQTDLEESRIHINGLRAALGDHARAVPAMHLVDAHRKAQMLLEQARAEKLRTADAVRNLDATRTADAEWARQIANQIGALQHPLELETGLAQQRAGIPDLEAAVSEAAEGLKSAQAELDGVATTMTALQNEVQAIPDVTDEVPGASAAVTDAQQQVSLAMQLAQKEQQVTDAKNALQRAKTTLQDAQHAHQQALSAMRADHAFALAATLVEGEPCLVCGSQDHPHPASPSEGYDETELVQRADVLERSTADVHKAEAELASAQTSAAELRAGLQPGDPQAALAQAQRRLKELLDHQKSRTSAQDRLGALQQSQQALTSNLANARLADQKARSDLTSANDALAKASQTVADACAGADSVAARVEALQTLGKAVQEAVDAEGDLAEATRAEGNAAALLKENLDTTGFTGVEQVEAAVLSEEVTAQYEADVKAWQEAILEVEATLRDEASVDVTESVNVEERIEALTLADQQLKTATEELTKIDDRIANAGPRRKDLATRSEAHATVVERTKSVIRMADLATARRQEVRNRVRLSSFVLMRRFDDVVSAANERLDMISEGRYQLVVEPDGLDKRGQAGLDLLIYDARSDGRRSVKSLSGGERFYVSLALALGLADVVRGEAGGVELGTLFIDEGFGSLDPETLQEVMEMLKQVQVGEGRVIGLISHVELLKDGIDARISVRRDPNRPGVSSLTVHT